MSTADPEHNTRPPTGALAGSGWQWQGDWSFFSGTVVAPDFFLTARHVGGTIGNSFIFRGVEYKTIETYDDPVSDLQLWRICGRFPDHASIYEGRAEKGATIVVFGRGTQRGEPVYAPDNPAELRGWQPGAWDGRRRWGTNIVTDILKLEPEVWATDFLAMDFDRQGGGEESQLTGGDSGGAVFLREGDVWKLAGINHAVDGPFNTTTNGVGFNAALFDARGFYVGEENNWESVPDSPKPVPSAFYAPRISSRLNWIREVLAKPSPVAPPPALASAASPQGPYAPDPTAIVDESQLEIRVPLPSANRFYRLENACGRQVISVTISGDVLLMNYR